MLLINKNAKRGFLEEKMHCLLLLVKWHPALSFACSCVQSWFHQSLFYVITAESLLIGPPTDLDCGEYSRVIVSPPRRTTSVSTGNWRKLTGLLPNKSLISAECLPHMPPSVIKKYPLIFTASAVDCVRWIIRFSAVHFHPNCLVLIVLINTGRQHSCIALNKIHQTDWFQYL